MKMRGWMATAGLAFSLAGAGCGQDDMEGGDTQVEDQESGVPVGAIPAPQASPANTAAAGIPLDSAGSTASADTTVGDSVAPELGR